MMQGDTDNNWAFRGKLVAKQEETAGTGLGLLRVLLEREFMSQQRGLMRQYSSFVLFGDRAVQARQIPLGTVIKLVGRFTGKEPMLDQRDPTGQKWRHYNAESVLQILDDNGFPVGTAPPQVPAWQIQAPGQQAGNWSRPSLDPAVTPPPQYQPVIGPRAPSQLQQAAAPAPTTWPSPQSAPAHVSPYPVQQQAFLAPVPTTAAPGPPADAIPF